MSFPTARPKATPAPSPRIRIVSTDRRYIGFHITNQAEGRKDVARLQALQKASV
jgi:hypothetical protein